MTVKRVPMAAAVATLALLATAMSAPSAHAAVTFESFTGESLSLLAGGHADYSTSFALDRVSGLGVEEVNVEPEPALPAGGDPQEVVLKLPPGTLGDVNNFPKCPRALFTEQAFTFQELSNGERIDFKGGCPPQSQIGEARLTFSIHFQNTRPIYHGYGPVPGPLGVYDVEPGPGEPALLGIQGDISGFPLTLPIRLFVKAEDNYAITTKVENIPRRPLDVRTLGASVTLWGIPSAHRRYSGSTGFAFLHEREENEPIEPDPVSRWKSFMENPTDCSEPLLTRQWIDTYEELGVFTEASAFPVLGQELNGCGSVPFDPSIGVAPSSPSEGGTSRAGAPTGVNVDLKVPQGNDPEGQDTSDVEKVVARLPAGMTLSPSAASPSPSAPNGLEACTDAELDYFSSAPAQCPAASQVGTAEVLSPLLPRSSTGQEGALTGEVYVGEPLSTEATSGKMFRLFLELQGFGVDIKVEGEVTLDPQTGQVTGTFWKGPNQPAEDKYGLPEQPFSEFRLHFRGGPNAPLVNPPTCGAHTASMQLTPYSNPTVPATVTSTFATSYDGSGASCPASLPFSPSASLSSADPRAGVSAPFTVKLERPDGSQAVGQITATLPPGLLGYLSKIALCDPQDAAAGTCPAQSRIGVVSGTAGPGSDPVTVPGNVYLAEGSDGYPFELSVVVPAVAGPFDIGNVVVIAYIKVNNNGSITAISGPVPSILDGVPVDIRSASLTIDRPGFAVNPTNCAPMAASATITSLAGVAVGLSAPFQVSGCQSLPFKPSFTVATQGATSRAGGESLTARVSQKPGEANIHSVKVELPKQLPSRLTTLQKACPESVFFSNPAACGRPSLVGTATAWTPLLGKPLAGPAYFVSHGGAKFPELIIVLQGDGVTIELPGETFISKTGITSSTFAAVPDVPISGFELNLPEGPYSALAANGAPCKEKLMMPTTITGQNGVIVKQGTRIAVTGCPKAKKTTKKKKAKRAKKARRARKADHPHTGQGRGNS
jgi:hypothetical protein